MARSKCLPAIWEVPDDLWERIEWGRKKHPLSHLPVKENLTPEDHLTIRNFLDEIFEF